MEIKKSQKHIIQCDRVEVTGITDKEKVMRGLECCIDPEVKCCECPYYDYGHCDPDDLRRDALDLLKEKDDGRLIFERRIEMERGEIAKAKTAENKEILDGLDLPKPEYGEEVWDYADRVCEIFKDIILPDDYGNLFEWLDAFDIGKYLEQRFGMDCEEVIKFLMC